MYVPLQQDVFIDYTVKNNFIECNYTQAKVFHETFGRDESDEAEIFRNKAWKLLSKAKTLLDHLKVPFWLSSGTCLGKDLLTITLLSFFIFKSCYIKRYMKKLILLEICFDFSMDIFIQKNLLSFFFLSFIVCAM